MDRDWELVPPPAPPIPLPPLTIYADATRCYQVGSYTRRRARPRDSWIKGQLEGSFDPEASSHNDGNYWRGWRWLWRLYDSAPSASSAVRMVFSPNGGRASSRPVSAFKRRSLGTPLSITQDHFFRALGHTSAAADHVSVELHLNPLRSAFHLCCHKKGRQS